MAAHARAMTSFSLQRNHAYMVGRLRLQYCCCCCCCRRWWFIVAPSAKASILGVVWLSIYFIMIDVQAAEARYHTFMRHIQARHNDDGASDKPARRSLTL